jgi:hypothetical protein
MLDASLDPLLAVFPFDHQLSNFVHRLLLHGAAAGDPSSSSSSSWSIFGVFVGLTTATKEIPEFLQLTCD